MSDKYAVIAAHRAEYPVTLMCAALAVSPSGFYAARARPRSARAIADAGLLVRVRAAHRKSQRRYGAPRVHQELLYRITHSYAVAITQIYAPDLARCGA